jgi:hypothetical protein
VLPRGPVAVHYSYPPYWTSGGLLGTSALPLTLPGGLGEKQFGPSCTGPRAGRARHAAVNSSRPGLRDRTGRPVSEEKRRMRDHSVSRSASGASPPAREAGAVSWPTVDATCAAAGRR